MDDSWSSDDEDRITGLKSAEKTRRRRGKKTLTPHGVVRCKVPGKITVPGRIIYFYTSEMLDELSAVYTTHGTDKLLYYIQQRFERSRRDTAAVTHSRGEDREMIRMVLSFYIAYLLTQDKRCTLKIYNLLRNIYNLNVTYVAVISKIQSFLFYYTMNDNNYSKAHKHLQTSLLGLQNVAPGACTADVYEHLAVMYEQLAYLMPHRKTSHLNSALHLYSVAREHYRCEGERTRDWTEVNNSITRITLYMINIKLNMPNFHGDISSRYGHLYRSSLVEDSGRRCTVTDTELSAAEYMWDHITRPIVTVRMNDLACVIYLYLRKSQVKKQGRDYTLALEACVTSMSWYNDLYDRINPAITTQIGRVLMELFQEVQEKLEATAADAGADMLHQEEEDEVVHSAECYIDGRVLCYTRTEEEEDKAVVYSDLSDISFDLSSDSDENIGHKQVKKSKPLFAQTSSSSLKKDAFITEKSCFPQSIADSDERLVTEPPYSNEGISTEDAVPEPEIDIDWSTVDKFFQYMGKDIDSSDENIVGTDSDHNANSNEGEGVSSSVEGPSATEHSMDFSNQMLLDIFSEEILRHNDQSIGMPEVTNTEDNSISMISSDSQSLECNSESDITEDKNIEKNVHSADSHSPGSVKKHDDNFLKVVGDNGSELKAKASTDILTKLISKTCTESLFDNHSDSEPTDVLTNEHNATDTEKDEKGGSFQPIDDENKVLVVTREGKPDTVSSSCESEYYSAQENIHTSDGQITDSDASGQEDNACDNSRPVNKVGSDIKLPVVQEVKYDPRVDDVTDSSGLDESSPNDDSQDTEVMDGY